MRNEGRNRRALFVVNGLGMGNSTRCYSIMQRLHSQGYQIDVATSDNGLRFFEGKPEVERVYAIESVYYGKSKDNELDILRTALLITGSLILFIRNARFLTRLIRKISPTVVIYDSQYNILPRLLTKTKIVALNNADMVVSYFFRLKKKPLSIFPQFFLIEWLDFLFHKLVPHYVVSPWADSKRHASRNRSSRIGLIVREGIIPSPPNPTNQLRRILIMLSGSTFGVTIDPSQWGLPYHFDVIGRTGQSSERVLFHGKLNDNIELLKQADLLIINGGFSAVSEALVLRKPAIVIPVENHAEQYVNAQIVQNLGVGLVATNQNVREQLLRLIENYEQHALNCRHTEVSSDGAKQSAFIINELVTGHAPRTLSWENP